MGTVHAKDATSNVEESVSGGNGKHLNLSQVSARIERVHIDGLRRTKDDIVAAAVQELFKSTDFAQVISNANLVRKRLAELGCFKQVDIFIDTAANKNTSEDGLEVTFYVRELNRIKANIHTVVGSNEGSLAFGGQAPNLFGRGECLQFDISKGLKSLQTMDLTFTKPLHTKTNAIWSTSIFQQTGDFPWSGYKLTDRGFLLDLAFNSTSLLRHNLQYEGSWREQSMSRQTDGLAVRKEYGHTLKSSIRHILTIDQRDTAIFPTSGAFFRNTVELAGLGGDIGFLKSETLMQVNFPLPAGIVLQGSAQLGLLRDLHEANKKYTLCDKFYLGGPTSVRGFDTRGIGPRKENRSIGANMYWASGLHLYSPLPFRPGRTAIGELFRLHVFCTVGHCEDISFTDRWDRNFEMLFNGYRASYGGGLALRIGNMAQVEVNYVVPFLFRNSDVVKPGVEFGFGVQFL